MLIHEKACVTPIFTGHNIYTSVLSDKNKSQLFLVLLIRVLDFNHFSIGYFDYQSVF